MPEEPTGAPVIIGVDWAPPGLTDEQALTVWKDGTWRCWGGMDAFYAQADPDFLLAVPAKELLAAARADREHKPVNTLADNRSWRIFLSDRQRKELEYDELYSRFFCHDTDGDLAHLLIAKLADMLDQHYVPQTIPMAASSAAPAEAPAAPPDQPICCCIPGSPLGNTGCTKPARWRIYTGVDPYEYTEACTDHVGELMTDAPIHYVVPLTPDAETRYPSDFMPPAGVQVVNVNASMATECVLSLARALRQLGQMA